MRILLAGVTTRAMAESAVRAGSEVVTVDLFGDLDQKRLCENVSLRERGAGFSGEAILAAARGLNYDAFAYAGGLENRPDVVSALAAGRRLLGNGPDALSGVRHPGRLFSFLVARGVAVPRVVGPGEPLPGGGLWLTKPLRGGGGRGIGFWDGRPLTPDRILQEYVEGVPASAAFVADRRRSLVLGWTEQLQEPASFLYAGNLLPLQAPASALDEVRAIADSLVAEFGLVGLNGFDFVLRQGRPVLVEVNPRYCASMELIERAAGVSLFGRHLDACEGNLRPLPSPGAGVWGKLIVYARETVRVGDTTAWIERGVRDVPHPGEVIQRGQPICTVLAWAPARPACEARLRADRERIWNECAPACSLSPLQGGQGG
jgi:predicted ATP-grasp superfamily ATP-dependent carboligase